MIFLRKRLYAVFVFVICFSIYPLEASIASQKNTTYSNTANKEAINQEAAILAKEFNVSYNEVIEKIALYRRIHQYNESLRHSNGYNSPTNNNIIKEIEAFRKSLPSNIDYYTTLKDISVQDNIINYQYEVNGILRDSIGSKSMKTVAISEMCIYQRENSFAIDAINTGYKFQRSYYDKNKKLVALIEPSSEDCDAAIEYVTCGQVHFKRMVSGDKSLTEEETKYKSEKCK